METWMGVLGVVLGVVLGWVLSQVGERQRMAREDRFRWAQERRRAYARFLTLSHRARDTVALAGRQGILSKNGFQTTNKALTLGEELSASIHEISLMTEHKELVATAVALSNLFNTTLAVSAAPSLGVRTPAESKEHMRQVDLMWGHEAAKFIRLARSELGLGSIDVAYVPLHGVWEEHQGEGSGRMSADSSATATGRASDPIE